ncbi:hypothetical protein CC78DRAFT_429115, partial [Lojkania enalia]
EEAIDTARRAIGSAPADHPDRATYLKNLSDKLGRRYERLSALVDLEEAIMVARQAVNLTPSDHTNRSTRLDSLG